MKPNAPTHLASHPCGRWVLPGRVGITHSIYKSIAGWPRGIPFDNILRGVDVSTSQNTHISPERANLPEQIPIVAPTGWGVDG